MNSIPQIPCFASAVLRTILSVAILALPVTSTRADAPAGNVVTGNATFNYNGNTTTINAADKTIIEYNRFNIGQNETVNFVQPTNTSRVLNRITGADPSSILGQLNANGIVYFVNPAGIYFGQNAVVNVGQLYAAAGNLSNADFLARKDNFTRLSGQVLNEGAITAGAIHLAGQNVRNTGALNSPAGLVMMASGDDVLIGRRGEHVFVNATAATRQQSSAAPGVENTGQINTQNGRALLAAGDLYSLAVQNSGVIRARDIELAGQGSGEVWNRGTLDASAPDSAGGRVQVTGQYVGLDSNTLIDASGATRGGEVLVGGDFQGKTASVRNATATYVAEGALIRADATDTAALNSTGGRVIVWADDTTRFHGDITARGNASGGFAEVSGKQHLRYTGRADLRATAPGGKTGTLLLDPDNITIGELATSPEIIGTDFFTLPAGADGDFNLYSGDLTSQLALSDVTVKTLTGDITVASSAYLNWNDPTTLTLDAGRDININQAIANFDTTDTGGLILTAARNITVATGITIEAPNITLTTLSGSSIINDGATLRVLGIDSPLTINGGLYVDINATLQANNGGLLVNAGARDVTIVSDIFVATATITNANNITVNTVDAYAGDLTFVGNAAITIGGMINANTGGTALGDITIASSNGAITATESALLQAPNSITLTARDDITIQGSLGSTDWPNAALTLASTTGSSIFGATSYVSGRSLTLIGGVDVKAYTGVMEPAAMIIGGDFVIDAQGRDVTLARGLQATNINVSNANIVTVADTGHLYTYEGQQTFAANNITVSGTLETLYNDSNPGSITLTAQTGTVAIGATGLINSYLDIFINGGLDVAAGASLDAGDYVNVNASGRDITIAGVVSAYTGGTFTNAASITTGPGSHVETISADGLVFVGNQAVSLGGAISAGSGGSVTVTSVSGTVTIASAASVTGRDIFFSGGLDVADTASLTANYGSGTISVNGQNRDVSILAPLTFYSGSLAITNANNLTLGNVFSISGQHYAAAHDITLTGTLGSPDLEYYPAVDISLTAGTGTVSIGASGGINAGAGNITINGGLNVAAEAMLNGTGSPTFIDAGGRDVTLGANINALSGELLAITATNAANISLSGLGTIGAQSYFASGNITIHEGSLSAWSTGDITLVAGGSINLNGDASIYATDNLSMRAGASIFVTSTESSYASSGNIDLLAGDIISLAGGMGAGAYFTATAASINIAPTGWVATDTGLNITATAGNIEIAGEILGIDNVSFNARTGTVALASTSTIFGDTLEFNGGFQMAPGSTMDGYWGDGMHFPSTSVTINGEGKPVSVGGLVKTGAINITNATHIDVAGHVESDTLLTLNALNSMFISGTLVQTTGAAPAMSLTAQTGTIGIASSAILSASGDLDLTGGLDVAAGAILEAGTYVPGSINIDALTRDVAIRADIDLADSGSLTIANARDILLASVFTPNDQTYAATRDLTLTGTLANNSENYWERDTGNVTLTAGRDLILTGNASINSAQTVTGTAGNTITLTPAVNPDDFIASVTGNFVATGSIYIGRYIEADTVAVTSLTSDIIIADSLRGEDIATVTAASGTVKVLDDAGINGGISINIIGGLDLAPTGWISHVESPLHVSIDANNHNVSLAGDVSATSLTVANAADILISGYIEASTITVANATSLSLSGMVFTASNQNYTASGNITVSGLLGSVYGAEYGEYGDINLTSQTGSIALAPDAAITSGGNISLTGGLHAEAGAILTTGSVNSLNIDALNRDVTIATNLALPSFTATNAANLTLANLTTASAQNLSAANNITLTGTLATTTAGANISLASNSGDLAFANNATINSAGAFTATAANAITFASAANTISAAGDISIATPAALALPANLTSASGSIAVNSGAGSITIGGNNTAAAQTYTAATSLNLTGTLTSTTGHISLAAGTGTVGIGSTASINSYGSLAITGGLNIAPNAITNTGSGINIDALNRDVFIGNTLALSSLTIDNAENVTFAGATEVSGSIGLTANNRLVITGTIWGASADIYLTSLTGTTTFAANSHTETNALSITGGLDIANGATLTGSPAIASVSIDALNRNVTIGAAITAGTFTATNAANITLANLITQNPQNLTAANNITLTGTLRTGFLGANIALTANTIAFGGNAAINSSGAFSATAASDITFASAANTVSTVGDITITTPAAIAIPGNLTTTSGSIAVNSSAGSVTIGGNNTAAAQTYSAATNLALTGTLASTTGNISLAAGTGTVSLNSNSRLNSAGALNITGGLAAAATSAVSAANALNINALNRDVAIATNLTLPALTVTNASNLTLANLTTTAAQSISAANNLTLTGTLATTTAGANISLASNSGNLALTGNAAVNSAGAFSATAANTITFASSANTIAAAGNISIATPAALTLPANLTSASGNITVNSGAGSITIGGNNSAAAQTYTAATSLNLTGTLTSTTSHISLAANAGTVSLNSNSRINSAAALNITGGIYSAASSGITAANGLSIDALNHDVAIATNLTLPALTVTNASNLTLANLTTTAAQSISAANNLTLTGTLATTTAGANISLASNSGNLAFANNAAVNSAGAFSATAANAITFASSANTISAAGNIDIASPAALTLPASITSSSGNIAVKSADGDITAAGNLSASGTLALTALSAITLSGTLTTTAPAGGIALTSETGDVTLAASSNLATAGSLQIDAGLAAAHGALIRLTGAAGMTVNAGDRYVDIKTALGTNGSTLPSLNIFASAIALDAVLTAGGQTYAANSNQNSAIQLNGALTSLNGSITLGAHPDAPAAYATIFSTAPGGILISATAGNVTFGHNDHLLAYHNGSDNPAAGTVTIIAGNTASLGSITASRSISVSGNQIQLEGDVYQAPAITLAAPVLAFTQTTAIVASASGALTIPALITGTHTVHIISGTDMTDGRMDAEFFPASDTEPGVPFPSLYLTGTVWGAPLPPFNPPAEEKKLSVIAAETNPANKLAPEESQIRRNQYLALLSSLLSITADTTISTATADQLRQLGIFPRPITAAELKDLSEYLGTLEQRIPTEIRLPEMYRVANGRLAEEAAQNAIRAWQNTFLVNGQSRVPEIQAALRATYADFRAAHPGSPAADYLRYIDILAPDSNNTRTLHAFFRDVRSLFLLIDNLGLTRNEVLVSKNVILRPLRVTGLPSNLLAPLLGASPHGAPVQVTAAY